MHGVVVPNQFSNAAAITAFTHRRSAAPPANLGAIPQGPYPSNKTGSAEGALDLAGEHIAVGVTVLPFSMFVVLLQPFLSQVPDFPADNRFMMILDTDLRHLAPITSLLMGQIIGGIGFFLNQVPHILFIFQDFDDGAGFPHASMIGTISFPVQISDNLSGSHLLHRIFLENQPNKFCPFGLNG